MNIILPGGSGFLGRAFASFAQEHGYHCLILTRKPRQADDASGIVMKLLFYIYIYIFIFIIGCCSGCSALAQRADLEARLDQQRSEAIAYSNKGQDELAVSAIREAIALSRFLPVTSWRSIESYDDAGLYYYSSQRYKESTYHQAIAVLLACGEPARASMYPIYVKRLSWAFARYRPDQRFQPIADNPLRLLNDIRLNLKHNRHIRRNTEQGLAHIRLAIAG